MWERQSLMRSWITLSFLLHVSEFQDVTTTASYEHGHDPAHHFAPSRRGAGPPTGRWRGARDGCDSELRCTYLRKKFNFSATVLGAPPHEITPLILSK